MGQEGVPPQENDRAEEQARQKMELAKGKLTNVMERLEEAVNTAGTIAERKAVAGRFAPQLEMAVQEAILAFAEWALAAGFGETPDLNVDEVLGSLGDIPDLRGVLKDLIAKKKQEE